MASTSGSRSGTGTGKKSTSSSRTRSGSNTKSGGKRNRTRRGKQEERAIANEILLIAVFALCVLLFLCNFGVIGPVAEELVFRGVIGRTVVDSGFARGSDGPRSAAQTLAACLVSGLFFGLPHVTGFSAAGLEGAVVMTLFGALLTWMSSVRSRSLAPAIAAHVTLNTAQLLLALVTL